MKKIIITEEFANQRLDKFLANTLENTSRSKIQEWIDDGYILLNAKKSKASLKLSLGDEIDVLDPPKEKTTIEGEDIPLDIVFEDDDIIVINKPVGLITHPGAGNKEHTLANALVNHSNSLSTLSGEFRPGIVQRLDKDTSGILVVAKNDVAHRALQAQLKDHSFVRKYYALVEGVISEETGIVIAPIARDKRNRLKMAVDLINGKEAETHFKVIKRFNAYTLLECSLVTGRTHQIRVHMAYIKHPIVGDYLYGKKASFEGVNSQLLHAHEIAFKHPKTGLLQTFSSQIPDIFENVLKKLN